MKKRVDKLRRAASRRLSIKPTRASLKRYLYLGIFVAIFSASLPFLDYVHQSTTMANPGEIVLLCLFFIIIGLLILATYSIWLKTNGERLFATIVITYAFTEHWGSLIHIFSWVRAALGTEIGSALIQLSLYLAIGLVAIALRRAEVWIEKKKWASNPLESILKAACIIIVALNSYSLFAYLSNRHPVNAYKPPAAVESISSLSKPTGPQRDIYYFVFDRYASSESLKNNFSFDNSKYLDSLKNKGFTVRDNAFSNYPFTAPSVASTLRMDYHSDLGRAFSGNQPNNFLPYKSHIQDSLVSSMLRSAGYDIYNVGNWWDLTRKQKGAINILPGFQATVLGKSFMLSELQSQTIDKTFLGGFLKRGINIFGSTVLKVDHYDHRQVYLSQLDSVTKLAKQKHEKPRFIFAHFLNTHPPYVFTSDGSPTTYNQNDSDKDVPRRVKYINQLEYANSSTEKLIDAVQKNAAVPPVIIIQSDEGPYPLQPVNNWKDAPESTLKLKHSILAAYSMPGISSDEVKKVNSSVNTFRSVFNNYFGTNFNYLPDCSYVYDNGQPFNYSDVTSKLHQNKEKCTK